MLQQLHAADRESLLAEIHHLRSALEGMREEQTERHRALLVEVAQAEPGGGAESEQPRALLEASPAKISEMKLVLDSKDSEIGRLEVKVAGLEQEKLSLQLRLSEAQTDLGELEGSIERATATISALQQVSVWV